MEQTLATIGEKEFSLPEDPETAALAFLQSVKDSGKQIRKRLKILPEIMWN